MTIEQQAILESIDMTLGEESRNKLKKQIRRRRTLGDCTYYVGAPVIKKTFTVYHVVCIVPEEKSKPPIGNSRT